MNIPDIKMAFLLSIMNTSDTSTVNFPWANYTTFSFHFCVCVVCDERECSFDNCLTNLQKMKHSLSPETYELESSLTELVVLLTANFQAQEDQHFFVRLVNSHKSVTSHLWSTILKKISFFFYFECVHFWNYMQIFS